MWWWWWWWLRAISAPLAEGTVLLLHTGHEGSHAMCEAFQYFCVPIDCSERFDPGKPGNDNKVDWGTIHERMPGSVVLLRLLTVGHAEAMADSDVAIMLVRSDLLRWSVSRYDKFLKRHFDLPLEIIPDPQFHENIVAPRKHLDVDVLRQVIQNTHELWLVKLRVLNYVKNRSIPCYVVTYESFLKGGHDYVRQILKVVDGLRPGVYWPDRACINNNYSTEVHRVHPTDSLADVILNPRAAIDAFSKARLPSWEDLATDYAGVTLRWRGAP